MDIEIKIKIPELANLKTRILEKGRRAFGYVKAVLRQAFGRALSDIKDKKIRGVIALILAILLGVKFGLSSGLLWFLFLIFLVYAWESRIIAFLALISLASCPALLSLKKDAIAEEMAVYSYFFLCMTVVLQIFEYRREMKKI